MSQRKELLIIIPAYNEAGNIQKVLSELERPEIASFADVLVVNDASSDGTNWIAKSRNHTLVTHVFNLGYGSALQLGYKYAIRRKYRYVIQMDGDGQHDVSNIPILYARLKEKDIDGNTPDIVLGCRFMKGSGDFPISLQKKVAYRWFCYLIEKASGMRLSDPTTGLQGLNRRTVLFYSQYQHFDDKYPDANILLQMLLLGFRVVEQPAVMHSRSSGISMHSGLKPILYMIRMTFSVLASWYRVKGLKIDVRAVQNEIIQKKAMEAANTNTSRGDQ